MVVGSSTVEMESTVEAKRLWNGMVKDGHNLLGKLAPEMVSAVTCLQGDGGVGSIMQVDFTPANKDFSYVKKVVEEVDDSNYFYCYSEVEGGYIGKLVSSAKFKVKITPKVEGGSVCRITFEYSTIPGVPMDEGRAEERKGQSIALFKLYEEYLLANPALYC